jgi:hypothetical protein
LRSASEEIVVLAKNTVGLLVRTPLVQKEEVLLLLSRAHRAYGRKSCTAGGEETGDRNEGTKAMAKECWLVL